MFMYSGVRKSDGLTFFFFFFSCPSSCSERPEQEEEGREEAGVFGELRLKS